MPEMPNHVVVLLVDKKILAGGIAMLAVGISLSALFSASMPIGQAGMTEDEALDLIMAQQELEDYSILAGLLVAVGFMLILISFGARRKRRRGNRIKQDRTDADSGDTSNMQRI